MVFFIQKSLLMHLKLSAAPGITTGKWLYAKLETDVEISTFPRQRHFL